MISKEQIDYVIRMARTYVMLYKSTGNRRYLSAAFQCTDLGRCLMLKYKADSTAPFAMIAA